jgi:hypothetical protein
MDRALQDGISNRREVEQVAGALLDQASAIIRADGENRESMLRIGALLRRLAGSPILDEVIDASRGQSAAVKLLGRHADGAMLSFYWMDGWVSPPSADVHWHNYWQSLFVASGVWRDTVWRAPGQVRDGRVAEVAVDRREVLAAGDVQVLGPTEPHGWEADERRRADDVVLLMWSGAARGQPRMDLDIATGGVRGAYGFLNPEPGA